MRAVRLSIHNHSVFLFLLLFLSPSLALTLLFPPQSFVITLYSRVVDRFIVTVREYINMIGVAPWWDASTSTQTGTTFGFIQ
jgi:hypothetical protein